MYRQSKGVFTFLFWLNVIWLDIWPLNKRHIQIQVRHLRLKLALLTCLYGFKWNHCRMSLVKIESLLYICSFSLDSIDGLANIWHVKKKKKEDISPFSLSGLHILKQTLPVEISVLSERHVYLLLPVIYSSAWNADSCLLVTVGGRVLRGPLPWSLL